MPSLPPKIYLRRKDVIAAVGGRRQLQRLELSKALRRYHLPGYSRAHYLRAEVQAVLNSAFCGQTGS